MTSIEVVKGYVPGVVGRVVELHGIYYNKYWSFGLYFEAKVATDLAEFLQRYNKDQDGFWAANVNGFVEGSITIDALHAEEEGAHLRWFIVSESLHGTGLGSELLNSAMEFCRRRDYPRIYLHTFAGLAAARHLYEKNGFQLENQTIGTQWGTEVNEQKFVLKFR